MNDSPALDIRFLQVLRRELLQLANHEDELAATEAAAVPYWIPTPVSAMGHRAAAAALREDADRIMRLASLAA